MDTDITTKFTIATERGIGVLLNLTQTIVREKFSALLPMESIESYLSQTFNEKALMVEVNSMSNQWLVVYKNEKAVGFARITSKGERPKTIFQKRVIRIADFGIVKEYTDPAIRQSLFDKCLSVCKGYEVVWINEYLENPLISFFESEGFTKQEGNAKLDELPLQSVCLTRQLN